MLPSYRTWSPLRVGVAAFGVVALGLGTWLVGSQLVGRANPSVNGVCDSVDRCLEPTQASDFIGRAIESDPDQAVGKHEWDFNGSGSYGTVVTCTGSACTQPCGDGSHSDCSVSSYSYSDPTFFAAANERQVNVHLRGVDTEGAAGAGEIRKVGVAIAYVGPDRGTSGLGVSGVGAGGFTVTWRDVTDIPGSAYTLHVDNLDDGTGDSISITNNKDIGVAYSVAYVAQPSTDYIVWVTVYYPTPSGPITRQSLPGDAIGVVPVSTPANGLPTLTVARLPGNVPPGMVAPHYQLLSQPNSTLRLNITVDDPDGDQLAELRIDGLASLPGATFTGFSTPTPGPVTRQMAWNLGATPPPSGDYSITVVARDVVGGVTSRPLVIRLNASPDAPSVLYVNTDDASAGLASGDPTPVAQVVDDNLADQNLKFTFRHSDPEGDAAATYRINVDTDSAFASPLRWDSGSQSLAVANGSRSANITYIGPALAYGTDYWWQVQAGDSNGNLSQFGRGRFKLRPTNYVPDLAPINATYSVEVGSTLTINLTATDQDVTDGLQTLTYFAQGGLPSPQMALNPTTGAFTFTPAPSDLAGSPFSVTLCVRDSYVPPAQDCNPASSISVTLNLVAPTSLNVAFTSPTAGTASWTHSAPGEQGFQLDQTAPVSTPNLAEVGANITNAGFTFNQCGSTSTVGFRVRAFVDAAVRMFSGEATANAPRPGFAPPTGLVVTATGLNTARLTWVPGTTGQSGYAVYNGATRLANAAAAATTYDFSGLTPASAYTLSVRPFVTVPGCPSGGEVLGGYANVNWTQPNPGISVSPASLAFGNVVKDTQSPTMTVRVTNSGSVTLTGITAAISGADAGQFSLLNTPPASIPPSPPASAYWDAQIQFRPTAYGAKAAQLQVQVPSFGLSGTSNLTGTGVPVAPVITSASWTANEPSQYELTWTWGVPPDNPNEFYIYLPAGLQQRHLTLGNIRSQTSQLLEACYTATGTTHMINLLAWDSGFSAPAVANLGQRPGWEPMGSPSITWVDDTKARLSWTDPAPQRSAYEVRVWNGATAVFNGTTTGRALPASDDTSIDLTGLAPGTNYSVTIRALRGAADLPGCSGTTYVYSAQAPIAYRQPRIDLDVYLQGTPANPTLLTELDAGGVWAGDDLTFPLRIHNSGDPITITSGVFTDALGTVFAGHAGPPSDPSLFSVPWPPTLATGADWNTNIQLQAADAGGVEETATIRLTAAPYGEVLTLPIRLVALLEGPGVSREIFATQSPLSGDMGNSQGETIVNSAQHCLTDSRANPTKNYRALLWYGNNVLPGVLEPGKLYRNQSGGFVFGTRPGSTVAPYIAHRAISSSPLTVWSGRGMSGPAYTCGSAYGDWTGSSGSWGSAASAGSLSQWSLSGTGSSNCGSMSYSLYCVEVPPLDGDYIVRANTLHTGNFAADVALGGNNWWERANDFCQKDAATDDRWEWRALLSAGMTLPQQVFTPGRNYYNEEGNLLFTAAAADQTPATLADSIESIGTFVWTGLHAAASNYCSASGIPWRDDAVGGGFGYAGDSNLQTSGWRYVTSEACSAPRGVYCVQQQVPAKRIVRTTVVAPDQGSFGDLPANPPNPGTWWEKANYICQNDPATDDSSQWKALLWGGNAELPPVASNGYITHAGTVYLNANGNQLFRAATDNDVPPILRYSVQSSNGTAVTGYGNPNGDCQDWTSTSGTRVSGKTNVGTTEWLVGPTMYGCSANTFFYCVEQ